MTESGLSSLHTPQIETSFFFKEIRVITEFLENELVQVGGKSHAHLGQNVLRQIRNGRISNFGKRLEATLDAQALM